MVQTLPPSYTTSEPDILLYERSTLCNESPNDFKPPLNSNKFLEKFTELTFEQAANTETSADSVTGQI
ncbi:hypothetical protein Hanom_Chr16g01419891 [Helianthus anomalus]